MTRKIATASLLFMFLAPAVGFAAGFERDLYFGMRNDADVTRLQEFLRDQGVYGGPVTGNFFTMTREGVKGFQKREGIEPQAGFFGPKTRTKANALLVDVESVPQSMSPQDEIKMLLKVLVSLQKQLKEFEDKQVQKPKVEAPISVETSTTTLDKVPPAFTKVPYVLKSEFVSDSPLGVRYPRKVLLDWETDEVPAIETVSCGPDIKTYGLPGKNTQYFPEPHTTYVCKVSLKDSAGNTAVDEVAFSSPSWISAATFSSAGFPATDVTPTKVGEFKMYNGTKAEVLYANIETLISDEMESPRNRNHEVTFIIRDGSLATDAKVGEKKFTFVLAPPKTGEPYKAPFTFPFPVTLKAGEERTYSLWMEQFKYVISGTLEIKTTKIETVTPVDNNRGGFDFILTREHAL